MLENKITAGRDENKKLDITKAKSNESNEINFLNLMEKKPLNKNKSKPKTKANFEYDS